MFRNAAYETDIAQLERQQNNQDLEGKSACFVADMIMHVH